MGARTRGIEGLLSAPDTSSAAFGALDQTAFDLYLMLKNEVSPFSATLTSSAPSLDKTVFASTPPTALGKTTDLPTHTISFEARYPQVTTNGACGLVTFDNGYVLHTDQMTINIAWEIYPADEFTTVCPTSRAFTPGEVSVTGTYSGVVDDITAISPVGTSGAITLRVDDNAGADATVAGIANITNWDAAIAIGNPNRITHAFEFDGDATMAGTNNVLPSGVIGIPDITEVVLRSAGSRDYTVPAFLQSLSFNLAFGSLVGFSGSLQCTGDLVIG